MLQLENQVVNNEDKAATDARVIVVLDLSKAFDRLKHEAILRSLQKLQVGRRRTTVREFRTAQLKVRPHESPEISTGSIGTPQGSVISPLLFNASMIDLINKLRSIDEVHHSIYADDVTFWTAGGRDGNVQVRLQMAVDVVEEYAKTLGLSCSPEKS